MSLASANAAPLSSSAESSFLVAPKNRLNRADSGHTPIGFHVLMRRCDGAPVVVWGITARLCEQFIDRNNSPHECINICMRVVERQ